MKLTKFKELCKAYSEAQLSFQNFQTECHELAVAFVAEMKSYFEVPESQFSLFRINENDEFSLVHPAVVNALTLRPDSRWHFGVGLTVCSAPETLPQELILFQILIRKDVAGNFFLKYGDIEREYQIEKQEEWNFTPFFDYLHQVVISVYDNQMTQFIGGDTRRRIGF